MDERTLNLAFDRYVDRFDGRAPGLDVLRRRTVRRRRRRAAQVVGTVSAAIVLLGVAVAVAGSQRDDGTQRVVSQQTSTTITSTTVVPAGPSDPAFTIGDVPSSLAFQHCSAINDREQPFAFCRYDDPTSTPMVDGITVSRGIDAATPEVKAAWAARDAARVQELAAGAPPQAGTVGRFTTIGGRPVVTEGVTEVVDGSSIGLPDRVARGYLVLVGDDVIQISVEHATAEQVAQVIGGLTVASAPPGLRLRPADLPPGATVLLRAQRPRWRQPKEFDPSASTAVPGTRFGAIYDVPGARTPLSIEIASDVDARALLDELRDRSGRAFEQTTVGGRPAVRIGADQTLPLGVAIERAMPSLLVAVGDRTLVQVSGDRDLEGRFDAIVAAVKVDLAAG